MINYREIEAKWQREWEAARIFESEPDGRKGLLVTAAIPYVNSPQHVGHLRTYGTADTYARYMRMRSYNVLYPFGFHATGTPVIAFAKRISRGERELMDELRLFHISDDDIKKMTDPTFITEYFIKRQEEDLRRAGLGIDWRRKFVTTEPIFSKLVEWQFGKLKEKGYLVKGTHPVGWCTNENNAVGQHDTKDDVQPKIEEITAIKFKDTGSETFFACATYRPETIYGVTNLFVNKELQYVIAKVNGQQFYLSKDAAGLLKRQVEVEVVGDVSAQELLGKKAVNPETGEEVPVLPGFFVKGDVGTGIVMSVPSHAPFDYAALERLKVEGYPVPQMQYKKLIEIEPIKGVSLGRSYEGGKGGTIEHPEIPALAYLELLQIAPGDAEASLEIATKMVYKEESRWGVLLVGKYTGRRESEARELIKNDMVNDKKALLIYEIVNEEPVSCRCGTRVVVNVVKDQWFIDYGNEQWKNETRKVLEAMRIYPQKYKRTFEAVIDWIDERATERAQGLGTRFPLNPDHIIESLSDSTIYMVFYTFDYMLRNAGVKPESLKPEFFDYVIGSAGSESEVAASTEIDAAVIKKCKDSLEYWYNDTSRHSGMDLVYNHLTMYIFNHVALLPASFAPKQIVVNGMVNYEGEKMSKSLGNIVPLVDGVEKYGSDPMRFVEVAGAELDTEAEFSTDSINSIVLKNEFLADVIEKLGLMAGIELGSIDYWLYSKLNAKIANALGAMDRLEYRSAYTDIFYNSVAELKHYMERGGHSQLAVKDFMQSLVLMLTPIMPHLAEELWHRLGNSGLAALQKWPDADRGMINTNVEMVEEMIEDTLNDISQVIALTSRMDANKGKSPKQVKIIIADDWKRKAYNMLLERKELSKVVKDPELKEVNPAAVAKFLGQFAGKLQVLIKLPDISAKEMHEGFVGAADYIKKRMDCEVSIDMESTSESPRAGRALPNKPSIDVLWG